MIRNASPITAQEFARFPLLLGLGPIRSGTTWVHQLLLGHSQVATTVVKEINFFNLNYEKGEAWYREHFMPVNGATRLLADISPTYIMDANVLARVHETVRDPLLMVNLRSPYERLVSWYYRYFEDEDPISMLAVGGEAHEAGLQVGLIAPTLERYIDLFGRNRLILVDYEDLKRNPADLARQVQRRLGLDIEMPRSITRVVNASTHSRSASLRRLVHLAGWLPSKVSPELFYRLRYSVLHDIVLRWRPLPQSTIRENVAVLDSLRPPFERDIDRLEELLQMDLSGWRWDAQVAAIQGVVSRSSSERTAVAPARPGSAPPSTATTEPRSELQ
jgi:Sulfotransferase domain